MDDVGHGLNHCLTTSDKVAANRTKAIMPKIIEMMLEAIFPFAVVAKK